MKATREDMAPELHVPPGFPGGRYLIAASDAEEARWRIAYRPIGRQSWH